MKRNGPVMKAEISRNICTNSISDAAKELDRGLSIKQSFCENPNQFRCFSSYSACQKNRSPKFWSASIDSPAFLTCRPVTNHTSFKSSRFKDSNELLFVLRIGHYLLLRQREEKSHVSKSYNFKHEALCADQYSYTIRKIVFSAFI